MNELIPAERIENRIFLIRGQKVMLDGDLAELYGINKKVLNQAVSRNVDRFPDDFMFKLTNEEAQILKSQFVTSSLPSINAGWGGVRKLPRVFTEPGVAMLSSVLRSKRAINVNIAIMRAFIHLRQIISSHQGLANKIDELEKKYSKHEIEISSVFKLLRQIMDPPVKGEKKIGFLR